MGNSSVVVSNLVGPLEKMALANHPINGLYFTMTGGPEVFILAYYILKNNSFIFFRLINFYLQFTHDQF
jgi:hypothetical protein